MAFNITTMSQVDGMSQVGWWGGYGNGNKPNEKCWLINWETIILMVFSVRVLFRLISVSSPFQRTIINIIVLVVKVVFCYYCCCIIESVGWLCYNNCFCSQFVLLSCRQSDYVVASDTLFNTFKLGFNFRFQLSVQSFQLWRAIVPVWTELGHCIGCRVPKRE